MGLVQVIIDESSPRTIAGTYEFDRASGGALVCPAGSSFPTDPINGEWFWRTDESKLYRYDGATWQAIVADVAVHAVTHESGGADEISVNGLSGVLADDQPAQVHAFGGAKHSADTLANLNAKVSDATLDDAGSPRPPTAHKATHEAGGADALDHQNLSGAGSNTHAQLDSHVASVANPHGVTKAQVGLGDLTNDIQLKRAAADFAAFGEKAVPVSADLLLIEDSAAAGAKKKVQVGNLPGGGSGADTAYFDGYDNAGGTSIPAAWTDVPLDTERKKTAEFLHTGSSAEIECAQAGTYIVAARVTTEETAGNRTASEMRLALDTGSGYAAVNGTSGMLYNRNSDQGENTATVVAVLDLAVGDKLKVQAHTESGTGTLQLRAGGSSLSIFSTKGPKGDKGDTGTPGSGTTLSVQDEGTDLPNTPHSVLDFRGSAVEATDQGGGVARVTVEPIFGAEYQHGSDETESTTTSGSWQQKYRFTTSNLPSGTYHVEWYFELALTAGWSAAAEARVQLDDTTEIGYASAPEPSSGYTNLYRNVSGVYVATFNGVHTFDVDFRSQDSGDVSGIRRVRIELWRVA